MTGRGQRAHAGDAQEAPALGAPHDGQRDPVIRQDGMEDRDGGGSPQEQGDRGADQGFGLLSVYLFVYAYKCRRDKPRQRAGVLALRVVREPAPDVIGVVFGLAEERGQVLIVHRVVDDRPLPARLDEAPVAQHTELV